MTAPATSSGVAPGCIRRRVRARGVFVRAAVVSTAVAAALAGCGDPGDPTTTRPESATAPASPPAPEPSPAPPGQDAATAPSAEAGDPAGDDPGAGGTGAAGTGAPGTDGTDGTAGASPGTGEPAGSGDAAAAALPSAMPSPVFLGEACATDRDTGPAMAVNGLVLYCVALPGAEAGSGSLGRWSVQSPQQQTQPRPEPGRECDTADVGRIVQDDDGRPVACLREPDGGLRWADVS